MASSGINTAKNITVSFKDKTFALIVDDNSASRRVRGSNPTAFFPFFKPYELFIYTSTHVFGIQ